MLRQNIGMKSLHKQHLDLIRKWQAGEKTPELAKKFEEISEMLSDLPVSIVDEDIRETVHEINNFIHTESWLKLLSKDWWLSKDIEKLTHGA